MSKSKGCGELCFVQDVNEYWVCGENNWYCVACTLGIKTTKKCVYPKQDAQEKKG